MPFLCVFFLSEVKINGQLNIYVCVLLIVRDIILVYDKCLVSVSVFGKLHPLQTRPQHGSLHKFE